MNLLFHTPGIRKFANAAERDAAAPLYMGEEVIQLDTGSYYYGGSAVVGDWSAGKKMEVPLPVSSGGTGANNLLGFLFGNGVDPFTALETIPLSGGVSGRLPFTNIQVAPMGSLLLGRAEGGEGDWQEIYLGDNLSMSGSTLHAAGGGGGGSGDVTGPATSTATALALWADGTGNVLADSQILVTGTTIDTTGANITITKAVTINNVLTVNNVCNFNSNVNVNDADIIMFSAANSRKINVLATGVNETASILLRSGLSSWLDLWDNGAPAGGKNYRIRSDGGLLSFQLLNDAGGFVPAHTPLAFDFNTLSVKTGWGVAIAGATPSGEGALRLSVAISTTSTLHFPESPGAVWMMARNNTDNGYVPLDIDASGTNISQNNPPAGKCALLVQAGVGINTATLATRQATGQTSNAQEWRNSSGTVMAAISNTGVFAASGATFATITVTGAIRTGTTTDNNVVIGNGAYATNGPVDPSRYSSVAIGNTTHADGWGTAVGTQTYAKEIGTVIGFQSTGGSLSFAGGFQVDASGEGSVAIGCGITTLDVGAIAIGTQPSAIGRYGTAIGYQAKTCSRGVALGVLAETSLAGGFSIAIGDSSKANSDRSVAIGEAAIAPTNGLCIRTNQHDVITADSAGKVNFPFGTEITGTPLTGTGTTALPLVYIKDPAATASTTWNTAGTHIGVNSHGAGDFLRFMRDGASYLSVNSNGNVVTLGSIVAGNQVAAGGFLQTYAGWIYLGGGDATHPLITRTGTTMNVRLGDDSAFAPLTASTVRADGGLLSGTGARGYQLDINGATEARGMIQRGDNAYNASLAFSPSGTLTPISPMFVTGLPLYDYAYSIQTWDVTRGYMNWFRIEPNGTPSFGVPLPIASGGTGTPVAPGASLYFGTDAGGVKGYYALPSGGGGGSGDVAGPASATDTAVALFNGTTGKLLKNSTVTVTAAGVMTVQGITSPGTGANTERFGAGATTGPTATRSTAVGSGANASGDTTVAVGFAAAATGATSVTVGFESVSSGIATVAIGGRASATGDRSMAFGYGALADTYLDAVFGSLHTHACNVYFGIGKQHSASGNGGGDTYGTTIQPSGGSGADCAAANLTLAGGRGTGIGTPGRVVFKTSTLTGTGTALQTLTERASIDSKGLTVKSGAIFFGGQTISDLMLVANGSQLECWTGGHEGPRGFYGGGFTSNGMFQQIGGDGWGFVLDGSVNSFNLSGTWARFSSGYELTWTPTNRDGTPDIGLGRNSVGVLEVNNGTLGALRDVTLRNITVNGTAQTGPIAVNGAVPYASAPFAVKVFADANFCTWDSGGALSIGAVNDTQTAFKPMAYAGTSHKFQAGNVTVESAHLIVTGGGGVFTGPTPVLSNTADFTSASHNGVGLMRPSSSYYNFFFFRNNTGIDATNPQWQCGTPNGSTGFAIGRYDGATYEDLKIDNTGKVAIGAGSAGIKKVVYGTGTSTATATTANSIYNFSMTVTGAVAGQPCIVGIGTLPVSTTFPYTVTAFCVASNTIVVQFTNISSNVYTIPATVVTVSQIQF